MIKRLKDTWGIFSQFRNIHCDCIMVEDRNKLYCSLYDGTKEDWFMLLRTYGRFTKVLSIETFKPHKYRTLVITIDKPDLVFVGGRKEERGKKAKHKYWDSKCGFDFRIKYPW